MPATYEPIATTTLSSNQATVTFNSIPSTYTDLVLVCFARGTYAGGGSVTLLNYFNNDTSALYSNTRLQGNGSTASSSRQTGQNFGRLGEISSANTTSGVFSSVISHIQNYTNTTTFKTNLVRHDNAALYTEAWVNLYRSTSAISRLDIQCSANDIASGSTFTLYGIKAA
jgi:hypothetical protein